MRNYLSVVFASLLLLSACVTPSTRIPQAPTDTRWIATHGAWNVFCNTDNSICDASMPITNFATAPTRTKTKVFAEVSALLLPKHPSAAVGFSFILPPSTSTTAGLVLSLDGNLSQKGPIKECQKNFCIARLGFSRADLRALERGKAVKITIVDRTAPNTPYYIFFPLDGLAEALADAHKRMS